MEPQQGLVRWCGHRASIVFVSKFFILQFSAHCNSRLKVLPLRHAAVHKVLIQSVGLFVRIFLVSSSVTAVNPQIDFPGDDFSAALKSPLLLGGWFDMQRDFDFMTDRWPTKRQIQPITPPPFTHVVSSISPLACTCVFRTPQPKILPRFSPPEVVVSAAVFQRPAEPDATVVSGWAPLVVAAVSGDSCRVL